MKRAVQILTAVALALGVPGFVRAQPLSCGDGSLAVGDACVLRSEALTKIEDIVRKEVSEKHLKSVILGIAVDGKPVITKAWGVSMTGVPATSDMHFRNGAVAIAYLGVVTLQLQEKGVLSLDEKLSKWFADYPQADRVTLAMLLNGTSGYADYVNLKVLPLYKDPFRNWQPDELIELGLKQPMVCEPGACWSYAHTNFVILGRVLEKATGRGLGELIREGVLVPLSLNDTRSDQTARIPDPVLHAFTDERGIYEDSTFWNPSWTLAQGAVMTSNIPDIVKSAAAVGTGALLSPQSFKLQLAPVTAKFRPWDESKYYGLGVFVIGDWIIQNPSFAGYAATMAYLPPRKLAMAVAVTVEKGAPDDNLATVLTREIARYLSPDHPIN